jgi:hypothetical protein
MGIPQGTRIEWKLTSRAPQTGTITGLGPMAGTIMGYIVELDKPVDSYPYTHCIVFDNTITKVFSENTRAGN